MSFIRGAETSRILSLNLRQIKTKRKWLVTICLTFGKIENNVMKHNQNVNQKIAAMLKQINKPPVFDL